ncbi:MAG: TerD family protein [Alphaproteobacteria bacterium]|nr:TerD family protein [Alphaproteobacteria bacterium]
MSDKMLKDQEVNLTAAAPALHRVLVGLGWQVPELDHGFPVDLDASAFLLNRDGRVRNDTDFIFYNNLESDGGGVKHLGDSTTGAADGDDEVIDIDLDTLSFDIEKISFSVTIHNAEERQQNFGFVKDAYIRVIDKDTNEELIRFDLTEDAAENNGFIFGELIREGIGWKFKAIGLGVTGGLYKIARDYSVNVAAP